MQNLQKIVLDILNNKVYDYIYTKQYDVGRQIQFQITENGTPLTLDGYTIIFTLKKADGTVIIENDESDNITVDTDYITLTLSDEMTVTAGKLPYQLSIVDGEVIVSTVTGHIICEKAVVQNDDVKSSSGGNLIEDLMELYDNNIFQPRRICLTANGWNNNEQTVQVQGVVPEEQNQLVSIHPANGYIEPYAEAEVYCAEQLDGALVFKCTTTPLQDLDVYVITQGIDSRLGNIGIIYSSVEPTPYDVHPGDLWITDYGEEEVVGE